MTYGSLADDPLTRLPPCEWEKRVGPNGTPIAAIAVASSLILVTHNTGEFQRVLGLPLEDWE